MNSSQERLMGAKEIIAQEKAEDGSVLWQVTAEGTLQVSVAAIEKLEQNRYEVLTESDEDDNWDCEYDDDSAPEKKEPVTWEEKAIAYKGSVSAPWAAYSSQIRNLELPEDLCRMA